MNHNTDCSDNATVRVYPDGRVTGGIHPTPKTADTYNCGYLDDSSLSHPNGDSPSKSSNERSRKGLQGLTPQANHQITSAVITLYRDYGRENLIWIVITYHHASKKAIFSIANNFSKLRKKLTYVLGKTGLPYLVVTGIQERHTYDNQVPCYDINILIPIGNQKNTIVDDIYRILSELAKEPIKPPVDLYFEPINNTDDDIHKLANYLVNQVTERKLKLVTSLGYFPPKTWHHLPKDLKEMIKPVTVQVTNTSIPELKAVAERCNYTIPYTDSNKLAGRKNEFNPLTFDPNQESQALRDKLKRYRGEHNQP